VGFHPHAVSQDASTCWLHGWACSCQPVLRSYSAVRFARSRWVRDGAMPRGVQGFAYSGLQVGADKHIMQYELGGGQRSGLVLLSWMPTEVVGGIPLDWVESYCPKDGARNKSDRRLSSWILWGYDVRLCEWEHRVPVGAVPSELQGNAIQCVRLDECDGHNAEHASWQLFAGVVPCWVFRVARVLVPRRRAPQGVGTVLR